MSLDHGLSMPNNTDKAIFSAFTGCLLLVYISFSSFFFFPQISFSQDNSLLNLNGNTETFRAEHMIHCAAENNGLIYMGTQNASVQVWDIKANRQLEDFLRIPTQEDYFPPAIRDICFSPGEKHCAVAVSNETIHFFELKDRSWQTTGVISGFTPMRLLYLSDGKLLIGDMGGNVLLLSIADGNILCQQHLEYDPVNSMALSPNKNKLAIAFGSSRVMIVDPANCGLLNTLSGHVDQVFDLDWVNDTHLVSGSKDKQLLSWQIPALLTADIQIKANQLYKGDRYITALRSNESSIVFCLDGESLGLISTSGGGVKFTGRGHTAPIQTIRFYAKNKFFSSGNDARMMLWEIPQSQ
jgi:WD40 repeat protein